MSGTIDHGSLLGLGDDDHPQYVNVFRLATYLANQIISHSGLSDLTNDDHPQYYNATRLASYIAAYLISHPTSHASLTGLNADDHAQYFNLDRLSDFLSDGSNTEPFVLATAVGGAKFTIGYSEEDIGLSTVGTQTDTSSTFIPEGASLIGITARVTQTISGATDWTVCDSSDETNKLATQTSLAEGSTVTEYIGSTDDTSERAARIITTGIPTVGSIRLTLFYTKMTAATV
jgi:hypothetical protein